MNLHRVTCGKIPWFPRNVVQGKIKKRKKKKNPSRVVRTRIGTASARMRGIPN